MIKLSGWVFVVTAAAIVVAGTVALRMPAMQSVPEPQMPNPLRLGVMDDASPERVESIYRPLSDYFSERFGVRVEMRFEKSCEKLGDMFHRGEVDFARFDGACFVRSEQRDGAIPLAQRLIDRHASSAVIARLGIDGEFPADFRNRSFLFGAASSTSSALMPRYFFGEPGLKLAPEQYFSSVTSLPSEDAVIAAIAAGEADAGVVNAHRLRQKIGQGAVSATRFRQVWESPPYTNYVWAGPWRIPLPLRSRFRDALLALDLRDPRMEHILKALGARAYVPATRADFRLIRRIVTGSAEYSRR